MAEYWIRWDSTNKKWEASVDGGAFADLVENPTCEKITGSGGSLQVIGKLGVGVSNPIYNLTVQADSAVTVGNYTLSSFSRIGTGEAGFYIGYHANGTVADYPIIRSGGAGVVGLALGGDSVTQTALFILSGGRVGVGTIGPTALFDINSDILRLRTAKTPASAGAAGNVGDICWDATYFYVCVATNTWRRVAHAAW